MNKQLNVIGSTTQTGYGIATINIIRELKQLGWDLAVFPKGKDDPKTFHHDAACLSIWHQFDLARRVGRGKHFGFPIFELDRFNEQEKCNIESVDVLFVCSEWAKNVVLSETSQKNVFVVPLGVDTNIFKPTKNLSDNNDKKTVFLNCGKWEVRKGHDILVDIFNNAFDESHNVELWMIPTNPFVSEHDARGWNHKYMSSKLGKLGKIKIFGSQPSQKAVADIMSQSTCGVFPARAEGWNLELLEMMAMGKPVITTNYSGHTEFCNDDNSFLVDIENTEPAFDGIWFFEQGNWAKIDKEEQKKFQNNMFDVYLDHQEDLVYNEAGVQTAERFTWEHSATKINNYIEKNA